MGRQQKELKLISNNIWSFTREEIELSSKDEISLEIKY